MSEIEFNKGRLIPVHESPEDVAERCITDFTEEVFDTKLDQFELQCVDYGYEFLNGKLYKIQYDIKSETDLYYEDVREDENGIIEFFTIHHNGGGSLMEVIENALERNSR